VKTTALRLNSRVLEYKAWISAELWPRQTYNEHAYQHCCFFGSYQCHG